MTDYFEVLRMIMSIPLVQFGVVMLTLYGISEQFNRHE